MEPEAVQILKWVYVVVFVVAATLVIFLVGSTNTVLEPISFSSVASVAGGEKAITVFRFLAGFYLFLTFIDAVSLFNYKSVVLRQISSLSSLLGFLLMGLASLFLIYVLGNQSITTEEGTIAVLYLLVSVGLFLLDLLTFFVEEENLLSLSLLFKKKLRK